MIPEFKNNQTVANTGLFYVCYLLSKANWNVLPTSRNAVGVDLVVYGNGNKAITIQIKTLSKQAPIPLGTKLDNHIADFTIVVVGLEKPKVYVVPTKDILLNEEISNQQKANKKSFWLNNNISKWSEFEDRYYEKWEKLSV